MNARWLRWYVGTTEDGKFRMVARNANVTVVTVIALWAALLEDAAHSAHRGVVTKSEDFFAAVLDLDATAVEAVLEAMAEAGLVSVGAGGITITNWNERQYETDTRDGTNAERQRRFRERKRESAGGADRNGTVTGRNGTVTDSKRPDTETEADRISDCFRSDRETARDKSEQNSIKGLAKGGRAAEAYHDALRRAEGFGLPTDEIEAATRRAKPNNPAAYFASLCVNRLQAQIPTVPRELIAAAMAGKARAYTLVCAAMMGPKP